MIMYHKKVNLSPAWNFLYWKEWDWDFGVATWKRLVSASAEREKGWGDRTTYKHYHEAHWASHTYVGARSIPFQLHGPLYFFKKIAFLELDIYNLNFVIRNKNVFTNYKIYVLGEMAGGWNGR